MKSSKNFWSRFRLPHALTLLFFIIALMGTLSLILNWAGVMTDPVLNADGTIKTAAQPILGAGILDWFVAIPAGMLDAIFIIIFLFVLGGFINVMVKSQSLEALIGKIAKYFHTDFKKVPLALKQSSPVKYCGKLIAEGIRQTWIIIPLMLFFSFAGTSYGMAEESLAFYAIIIPIALVAGFDVYTGFLIIFVGAGVGVMGSTINPFSVLIAISSSGKDAAGVALTNTADGAAWRWIGWVVFTLVTIIFVMVYAARVKMNKNNSALKDLFEVHAKTFAIAKVGEDAPTLTKRRLLTVIIFLSSFIIMVFAMLDGDGSAGTYGDGPANTEANFADNQDTSWLHNNKIYDGMFGEAHGWKSSWLFGQWYLGTLSAYFFIISLVIAAINWKSEKVYVEEMVVGAKDMLGVALAVGIARGISVILKGTHMQTLFAQELGSALSNVDTSKGILVPLLSYILFIPLTFIIPSTSGLAGATFPVVGPALVNGDAQNVLSGTVTAYAWGAGLANMAVPTYGVVIGALAITKIPFDKFLRAIWKYLLLMFLVGMVMIIIGGLTVNNDGVTQGIF